MRLFRVEDKDGKGYKAFLDNAISNWTQEGFYYRFIQTMNEYETRRPAPENDGIDESIIEDHHLFAFQTVHQLNAWFLPADLVMGALLGGRIAIYEVDEKHTLIGNKQVAFDSRFAKKIDSVKMDHFLPDEERGLFDFKEIALENQTDGWDVPTPLLFLLKST